MPRPLRIEYDGAWYHVMNRGANHQAIFYNDYHRNIFLSLLREIKLNFYVETHAYCLMDNHYHLLLHTPIANLGKSIRHLDGVYTQRFNRFEKRDGPLFRGRYKAILLDADSYLLALTRYIHLNPVNAKICNSPIEYYWSSYRDYIGVRNKPEWLHTSFVLEAVNKNKEQYIAFVEEGDSEELTKFYSRNCMPSILGEKEFINDRLSKLKNEQIHSCLHDINRTKLSIPPEKIVNHLVSYFKTDFSDIKKSIRGKINLPKMIGVFLFRQLGQLPHQCIGEYFDCEFDNIATTLKRVRKLMKQDVNVRTHIEKLIYLIQT